jgi:hypothetical protein
MLTVVNRSGLSAPDLPPVLLGLGAVAGQPQLDDPLRVWQEVDAALANVFPWSPDRAPWIARLEERAQEHRAAGESWLEAARSHPWIAPFAPAEQAWVDGKHRDLAPPGVRAFSLPQPSSGQVGGTWTATLLAGGLAPWADAIGTPAGSPVWSVPVRATARVLEVRGPGELARLVDGHPLLLAERPERITDEVTLPAPLYGIDWASAAAEWDGVRMTLDGIARTAFVEIPVRDGATTFVTDTAFEWTIWLRPVFEEARPIGLWLGRRG